MSYKSNLTVGELIDHLSIFSRDATVFFGGSEDALTFYRTKLRGKDLVQVEFSQQIYRTDSGKLVVDELT
ncbi:MAG TPA: hypothetical protein VJP77_05105 [Planctomycetota bacterium]|nr:hypothetical protein [Planctomycetota bacterium]